jgi:multicomponent Na+:H+ antiporter subunit D
MENDLRLALAIAVPFASALLVLASRRALAPLWSLLAAAATFILLASHFPAVRAGAEPALRITPLIPGTDIALRLDALGAVFALLASGLWILASIYSAGYARALELQNRRRFFACFAAAVGSAVGIALAANVLTFLLFFEALTLSTYPLVLHRETPAAFAAARRYLAYALTGGISLTAAAAWTWLLTGSLEFSAGGILSYDTGPGVLLPLFALYAIGFGVKAAVMPFHAWLPAAMVAPVPVSALLHAVAVVKAGVFGALRVTGYVFGPELLWESGAAGILAAAAGITVLLASIAALAQDDLKRRLAYSTVANLSYIVLGAALLQPNAMKGGILHLANHGFAKITLFFCAGAIHAVAHVEKVSQLKGLARRMPWTFAAFSTAALALIGVPGLCGFTGKLFLCRGAIDGSAWLYLAVVLGGSLLSAAYLLPILRAAYFEGAPGGERSEASPMIVAPLIITALLSVVFGLVPWVLEEQFALATQVTGAVFGGAR